MIQLLFVLAFVVSGEPTPSPVLEAKFTQVHPRQAEWGAFQKSARQPRAVVLVPGLSLHPVSVQKPHQATFQGWQQSDSTMVKTLGSVADVYAFAYSQNVPVEEIARCYPLRFGVQTLRSLGYEEIILVGHSAGGLVCRILVEDHPEEPVTKVVQLASPNGGSSLARATITVRAPQEPFLLSLSKKHRAAQCGKPIPPRVEFLCIVCNLAVIGDGWVANRNQWPNDLQAQGIPALIWFTSHHGIVRSKKNAERLRDLLTQDFDRWNEDRVGKTRKRLWWMGKKADTKAIGG